jgi:hypothetical protein
MIFSTQTITNKFHSILKFLHRYRLLLVLLATGLCYAFLITRITAYTQREPAAGTSDQAIKRLTIDQESITKIEDLEDQNVEVRTLFEEARQNPFSEE